MDIALVIVLAMAFTYVNGFHDAPNAIATSVSTRALTPRIAVGLAALANLCGAFFGQRVAETIGAGLISPPHGHAGLLLCAAALLGAVAWNMVTWWKGLPSSSSHALIGGLVGAALAGGVTVQWDGVLEKVLVPMLVVPAAGLVGGYAVMAFIVWRYRHRTPGRVAERFRTAQTISATAVAFGHGMQDAGKTAGVVMLALSLGGVVESASGSVPWWVLLGSAVVISLGTLAGGWRIMRTLGQRIIDLDPAQGFAAESAAALSLIGSTALQVPVSSTHAITASIIGAGATRSLRSIQWRIIRRIVLAWVLTFPAAGLLSAATTALAGLALPHP